MTYTKAYKLYTTFVATLLFLLIILGCSSGHNGADKGISVEWINEPSIHNSSYSHLGVFHISDSLVYVRGTRIYLMSRKDGKELANIRRENLISGETLEMIGDTLYIGTTSNNTRVISANPITKNVFWEHVFKKQEGTKFGTNEPNYRYYLGNARISSYEDKIYVSTSGYEYKVSSLNSKSGSLEWETEFEAEVPSPPFVTSEKVYILEKLVGGGGGHKMYAIDRINGSVDWSFEVEEEEIGHGKTIETGIDNFTKSGICKIGETLIYATKRNIYGIESSNGSKVWSFSDTKNRGVNNKPVCSSNAVFASIGSNLYRLSPEEGKEIWRMKTDTVVDTEMIIHNGKLLTGIDSTLTSINPENGNTIDELKIDEGKPKSINAKNSKVYIGTDESVISLDI